MVNKYLTFKGVKYGYKLIENYCEDGYMAIRISSNAIYNLYFWRDGYIKPEAYKGNVREFPEEVVLKAFEKLRKARNTEDTKAVKDIEDVKCTKVISNKMFRVTYDNGMALFTNANDVVAFCIGKGSVNIEEVSVSINTNAEAYKDITTEAPTIIKEEVKKEKPLPSSIVNKPVVESITESVVEDTIEDVVEDTIEDTIEDVVEPVVVNKTVGGNVKVSADLLDEVEPVIIKSRKSYRNRDEKSKARRVSRR